MKSNSQLQADVLNELKWEPSVDHSEVGVAVEDGVVTLSGIVHSYAEKMGAEAAARRVKGVRAIAEELTVRYPYQPKTGDAEIAKRICDVLAWDPMIPDDKIDVTVTDGVVKLAGTLDWHYQSDLAYKAASKIGGVVRINNQLRIKKSVNTPDVKRRIEDALDRQAAIDAQNITVSAIGHKVKLGGRVSSWNERRIAEKAAWAAPGVTQVEDDILVN